MRTVAAILFAAAGLAFLFRSVHAYVTVSDGLGAATGSIGSLTEAVGGVVLLGAALVIALRRRRG